MVISFVFLVIVSAAAGKVQTSRKTEHLWFFHWVPGDRFRNCDFDGRSVLGVVFTYGFRMFGFESA